MFDKLAAPFPRREVHWRAQTLTKNGDKALALAYLDARDVMRRLDGVVGPASWTDGYVETHSGRVICTLSILIQEEDVWVSKSDGAGDTAVEGEKGALSDAFKRAAVKWGIGRYLYALGTIWVPCETWTGGDGKPRWKRWAADPWDFVQSRPIDYAKANERLKSEQEREETPPPSAEAIEATIEKMADIWDKGELGGYWNALAEYQPGMQSAPGVAEAKDAQKAAIEASKPDKPDEETAHEGDGMSPGGHL